MIKKLAWNTFKNTGNINTFLELVEVESLEKKLSSDSSNNINDNLNLKNENLQTNSQEFNGRNKKQL
jgi:hypothetical protein